jgi:hypothetical protein
VRLGKMNYEDPRAVMHGPFLMWHHVDCFVARRDELMFTKGHFHDQVVNVKN